MYVTIIGVYKNGKEINFRPKFRRYAQACHFFFLLKDCLDFSKFKKIAFTVDDDDSVYSHFSFRGDDDV